MKYSVYFTLNSSYIKFGRIWIESLHDKVNMNNVKNIFISDTGLKRKDREYFLNFDKVKIVDSGVISNFDEGTWGKGWHQSVTSKTKVLKELVKNNEEPIVMVDGDCMFLNDISHLINTDYDLQICHRPHLEQLGVAHLASFVSINNKKCLDFIDEWIDEIKKTSIVDEQGKVKAKETPSLSRVVRNNINNYNIQNIPENWVSVMRLNEVTENSVIAHFKGSDISNTFDELFEKRVIGRGWENMVDKYIKEDLNLMFLCSKKYYDKKMSRVRFHSMEAVSEITNTMWWGPGWDGYDDNLTVQQNIDRIETKPDMIVTYKPLDMRDMKSVDVPVCLRYNETYDWEWTLKEIDDSGAEFIVFHHENDLHIPMSEYQKHYGDKVKCVYVPHCAEKSIYKKMDIEKEYDVLLIGAVGYNSKIGQHYPLRDRMVNLIQRLSPKYKVGIWQRPPGRIEKAYDNKSAIQFAEAINKAKICVTDSGAPKSRFGKYIEVPMCGTSLAADIPNDCEEFKDFVIDINMDMTDEEILDKLIFYLENSSERRILEEAGLKWSENYTQQDYARDFVSKIKLYLGN